uniref:Uncharacterized protein n=1 Tax=Anas zonorhyncha TaxID=75864 RepID=A0A8B9ZNI0_9AVES
MPSHIHPKLPVFLFLFIASHPESIHISKLCVLWVKIASSISVYIIAQKYIMYVIYNAIYILYLYLYNMYINMCIYVCVCAPCPQSKKKDLNLCIMAKS